MRDQALLKHFYETGISWIDHFDQDADHEICAVQTFQLVLYIDSIIKIVGTQGMLCRNWYSVKFCRQGPVHYKLRLFMTKKFKSKVAFLIEIRYIVKIKLPFL